MGFPGGALVKNPPASVGDAGLIPGSGRSPKEGNGNPLQYSCLVKSMDREAWRSIVDGGHKRIGHHLTTKQQQQMLDALLFSCSFMSDSLTTWTAACQASMTFTISLSWLKLMFIELMMSSNHLVLCFPFSSCLQSFSASGSFLMNQFFASGGQGIGASASGLLMNIQD